MKNTKAIVIGAGIGGLATAAKLAKQGFKVTVFEKTDIPGGRCGQIRKDGHYFDTGPTFFLFTDIYKKMFLSLGERVEDYLTLKQVEPNYQLFFEDGTKLCLTSNLQKMHEQLEKIEPGSFHNYLKFLDKAYGYYQEAMPKFIEKDFVRFQDYFNLTNLSMAIKIDVFKNHYSQVEKFFKSPQLKATFTFQDSYLGLSPTSAPAFLSIFSTMELLNGIYLPVGGMYQVVEALFSICKKNGVKFKFNSQVAKINTEKDKVISIDLENEKNIPADLVVTGCDLPYAYENLLPKSKTSEKLKQKEYSHSTISYFWATKKKYPQLATHNLFFHKDYCKKFDEVAVDNLHPSESHFYIHCPSRTDLGAAPENGDSITAMVPTGNVGIEKQKDWTEFKNKTKRYIIKRLKTMGITDFEENIKFEIIITPKNWQNRYNLSHGAVYGLHHNMAQLAYFRPHKKHKEYKNLYFVGSNTHPGSSVPTVLLSADFVSKLILKDFKP